MLEYAAISLQILPILVIILAILALRKVQSMIHQLLGFDIATGQDILGEKGELAQLFKENQRDYLYNEYKNQVTNKLMNYKYDVFSFLLIGTLILFRFYGPIITHGKYIDPRFGFDRFETWFGKIITIYSPWIILLGFAAALDIVIVIFIMFKELSKIGNFTDKLSLRRIKLNKLQTLDLNKINLDIIQEYSIQDFKYKANIIPYIGLRISIMIFSFLISCDIISILVLANIGELTLKIAYYLVIAVVNLIVILISLYIFIKPQISIKNLVQKEKESRLTILEKLYTNRELEIIKSIAREETPQARSEFIVEAKFLERTITDIKNLFVWPFNYQQGVTFVVSASIPLLSILISFTSNFILT